MMASSCRLHMVCAKHVTRLVILNVLETMHKRQNCITQDHGMDTASNQCSLAWYVKKDILKYLEQLAAVHFGY